jgi:hypothetical protein
MNNFLKCLIVVFCLLVIAVVTFSIPLSLKDRVEVLEGTVKGLEGAVINVVGVTCIQGVVNGPSEVTFVHPQIIINHSGFPFSHYFEIVALEQSVTSTHLISFSSQYEGKDVLDGFLGDIRGGDYHILNPDVGYTLRVWRHEYENMPQFEESELVFEGFFTIPVCR